MKKILLVLAVLMFALAPTVSAADSLGKKLGGKILIQVEAKGEAWYVNPETLERYFLGRPADAFGVMKKLGLGVSNKDFASFEKKAPKALSGKILIKVQDSGKAYYVFPDTLKLHFLGRPEDAFKVMRELGLGISTKDLETIKMAKDSADPKKVVVPPVVPPVAPPADPLAEMDKQNKGVVLVACINEQEETITRGSGSLGHIDGVGYVVLTNDHVITDGVCAIGSVDINPHLIDIENQLEANSDSDSTFVPIIEPDQGLIQLIDSIPDVDTCSSDLVIGTTVYATGYPFYAVDARITTSGTISGRTFLGNTPHPNYFITARIDFGNSGGVAFAWSDNKLCFLGVPTWLAEGTYENSGVVQNFWNILQNGGGY